MKTNPSPRLGWKVPAGVLTLLVLMTGTARAADPASMAYHFSSHPMISGTVVTVNDHQMVVNTDQGEQVTLELDTRTMAPRDLGPGMVVRTDFKALEDCRLYAKAVHPVRGSGSTERLQAYARTQDSREVVERNASADGGGYVSDVSHSTGGMPREAGPQLMRDHSTGATMTAVPSTRDYIHSTRPMISGEVLSVNDHRLVIRTVQGQRVGMVMDSQTLLPGAVGPGLFTRAEFERLKDGRYYAKAVSLDKPSDLEREQAYAHTIDSDNLLAERVPECGAVYARPATAVTAVVEPVAPAAIVTPKAAPEPILARNEPAPAAEVPPTLPQTASGQPLLLLLGALSITAAGVVRVFHGQRRA